MTSEQKSFALLNQKGNFYTIKKKRLVDGPQDYVNVKNKEM